MTEQLTKSGIATARLDTLVLLEDITRKDRAWLLAHDEIEITKEQYNALTSAVNRRNSHEPLAYIRGTCEFYGRTFKVNADVLIPRPESEIMIEMLCSLMSIKTDSTNVIIDVGTGSGALAITAKCEIPETRVIATDIDNACIAIARQNAKMHAIDIEFLQGNLLDMAHLSLPALPRSIILANLPYVPIEYKVNEAAQFEPKHALYGGEDGLDLYRGLFSQIARFAPTAPQILTESLPFQHVSLSRIASNYGYYQAQEHDFIQLFTPNN